MTSELQHCTRGSFITISDASTGRSSKMTSTVGLWRETLPIHIRAAAQQLPVLSRRYQATYSDEEEKRHIYMQLKLLSEK
jgi:hypothetical protein